MSEVAGSDRRRFLGEFLRAHRESVSPEETGFPSGGNRRTPGLRREEVAILAGVGVTWYTWLEQGRPIRPSEQVLSAIATALLLDEIETDHLFELAGVKRRVDDIRSQCQGLPDGTQEILDQLDPFPALVRNGRFDILASNAAVSDLIGVDVASVPLAHRNCLYLALTNPHWRASVLDWEESLSVWVGQFRAAMALHVDDPIWKQQLELFCSISAEFAELWKRQQVSVPGHQLRQFIHSEVGPLSLRQSSWLLGPRQGSRMLVSVPADAPTALALEKLRDKRLAGRRLSAA